MKKVFIDIIIVIFFLMILIGCNSNNEKTLEDKTNEEINYLEWHIFTITNKYVKGEYGSGEEFLWKEVEKEANKINNELDTIMIDFTEYDISKEELISFRNEINDLILAINDENETDLINRCNNLYALLTTIFEKSSQNDNHKNVMKIKSLILSSYNYSNSLDWENAKLTIDTAKNKYSELFNDVEFMKEYSYSLNKIYILIEEMKNAIDMEQLELVKIKYIAISEEL